MTTHTVELSEKAEQDLRELFDYISGERSPAVARAYIDRIVLFLNRLDHFPMRGTQRSDLRPGLRVVGFERRISIATKVDNTTVKVLRILYGGRSFGAEDFD